MTEDQLSAAIRLQDILVARATGDQSVAPQEFMDLRLGLLSDPAIRSLLPRFVLRCHSLLEFWNFIQPKFQTYRDRRDYISAQFDPLLTMLENGTAISDIETGSDKKLETSENEQASNSVMIASALMPIPDRPRIFVASSKEGLLVVNAIHERLDHDAEVTVWDQGVFDPSYYTLEALEQQLDVTDCAIFVFSPDDISTIRNQQVSVVRDNVLFELGLFIGRLGRKRCYIVHPRDGRPHLASDLSGMTTADYDDKRSDNNILAALAPGVNKILRAIDAARAAHQ